MQETENEGEDAGNSLRACRKIQSAEPQVKLPHSGRRIYEDATGNEVLEQKWSIGTTSRDHPAVCRQHLSPAQLPSQPLQTSDPKPDDSSSLSMH